MNHLFIEASSTLKSYLCFDFGTWEYRFHSFPSSTTTPFPTPWMNENLVNQRQKPQKLYYHILGNHPKDKYNWSKRHNNELFHRTYQKISWSPQFKVKRGINSVHPHLTRLQILMTECVYSQNPKRRLSFWPLETMHRKAVHLHQSK